jgi:OHCU decarboxylase
LNELPAEEAMSVFLDCCGSKEWAQRMTAARPFRMLENLFVAAGKIWVSLSPADHLEAFASHPKIGSKEPEPKQKPKSAEWAADEQSGMDVASETARDELAECNRLYLEKFGFIFIVCATARSADEMLAICKARLGNSLAMELKIAAEEQRQITEIRLNKLLER